MPWVRKEKNFIVQQRLYSKVNFLLSGIIFTNVYHLLFPFTVYHLQYIYTVDIYIYIYIYLKMKKNVCIYIYI